MFSKLLFWALKHKRFTSHEVARLAICALKDSDMDIKDRALCTAALLEGLNALPIRSIISTNELGVLLLNGRGIGTEQAIQLREGARTMINSSTRRQVKDQVRWLAVDMAVNQGLSPDQILFAKAALWCIQEEEKLYFTLLGENA